MLCFMYISRVRVFVFIILLVFICDMFGTVWDMFGMCLGLF